MSAPGVHKSGKLDAAQAIAKSCAGRPDFLPCDGLSICATHSHGKCFKLHWCCHLGWCHCKYVYQPMTSVCQLPSTPVPATSSGSGNTTNLSASLTERFLRNAPCFLPPPCPDPPKYCVIADLFVDDYIVRRINGKMCYVQRTPPQLPAPVPSPLTSQPPPDLPAARKHARPSPKTQPPKMDHCSSPSSSEDSGINAVGLHYMGSCDEDSEEDDELSSDVDSSPSSLGDRGRVRPAIALQIHCGDH
ncbi:hypothetical protein GJAV_G00203500 [Gymnothorax javanicus]|nr:hypothetical protein GJAV_G00203500 [Gymnothorax javanicus]